MLSEIKDLGFKDAYYFSEKFLAINGDPIINEGDDSHLGNLISYYIKFQGQLLPNHQSLGKLKPKEAPYFLELRYNPFQVVGDYYGNIIPINPYGNWQTTAHRHQMVVFNIHDKNSMTANIWWITGHLLNYQRIGSVAFQSRRDDRWELWRNHLRKIIKAAYYDLGNPITDKRMEFFLDNAQKRLHQARHLSPTHQPKSVIPVVDPSMRS